MTVSTLVTLGYIGPGGGLELLAPLIGVIVSVVSASAMVVAMPLRALYRRLRFGKAADVESTESGA